MTDDPQEWYCPRCQTWTGPCEDANRCEKCGTPLIAERDRVRLRDLGLPVTDADEQAIQDSTAANTAMVVEAMREKAGR